MARPTKRTPEREQRLIQAIEAGNTRRAAALYAGISDDTLERWATRYADFADRLSRAEAVAEVALVALIRNAAREDWRAAAHLLERRFPETWGRRVRVDIETEIRDLAIGLGLDADAAVVEANRVIREKRANEAQRRPG